MLPPQCLANIRVEETPLAQVSTLPSGFGRLYKLTLEFFDPSLLPREAELSLSDLVDVFRRQFITRLKTEIEKEAKKKLGGAGIGKVGTRGTRPA